MGPMVGPRRPVSKGRRGARGQVMVLVVFGMVALMAGAGLAFDVGRFFSERRSFQNAADAGRLPSPIRSSVASRPPTPRPRVAPSSHET